MRNATKKSSGKVLASVVLLAGAAGVAGLGTFGSFTSTTSASQAVGTGTVKIDLGASGAANRLSVAASGLVPGDTVQRAVSLSNNGNQDLSTVSLTTTATTSSKLDTDATDGLQLTVESCPTAWVESGTAPAYTYTCSGTIKTVVASKRIVGANVVLGNLQSLSSTKTDYLRVKVTLPDTADNTFQGLNSVVGFDFTGTQRTATAK